MRSAPGALQRMASAVAGFAVLVAALLTPIAPSAQARGSLTGTVTDRTSGPLPGVEVTVASASLERTAVTAPDGVYRVPDLPPGTYTVTARLPGFQSAVAGSIAVDTGATTAVNFALELSCVYQATRVDFGIARSLQESAAIVHIRISDSRPGEPCSATPFCVCTEHVADVIGVLKSGPHELSGSRMRFLQEGAGRIAENGRTGAEKPYAPGQEYVAFLQPAPAAGLFLRFNGPIYMFPIRDGRVEFQRTDAPGLQDGMPVEEFTRAVRARAASRGR